MNNRAAFVLVLVLFLIAVLLVLGMGMLGRRVSDYRAAARSAEAAQALQLAEAGLEEARIKLGKDRNFPPPGARDQVLFSFSEVVTDLDGVTVIGSYTVTVDSRWKEPPFQVLRVSSVGTVGLSTSPVARRKVTVELDLAEFKRVGGGTNPDHFRFIHREDEGSL